MMKADKKKGKLPIKILAAALPVCLIAGMFFAYTSTYYRADDTAQAALMTDDKVTVGRTDYGYLFDGPSETDALIFYPGGKVEETAYAPMLRSLAEGGVDVCLVKMPFRLAVFGKDKAESVISETEYERYYIGGHSLGGVMASSFAEGNSDKFRGVIFCAAYPIGKLPDGLFCLSVYGSNDGVLNMDKYEDAKIYFPHDFTEVVIEGGNHAGFGSYGAQEGDLDGEITALKQQEQTVGEILSKIKSEKNATAKE